MNIFSIKGERRARGLEVTSTKKQCRLRSRLLGMSNLSLSQRTVHECNILTADCIGGSSVNMFKNKKGGIHLDR